MEFVLISYPEFFKSETAIITSLLKQYDFIFHLRKFNANDNEYVEFIMQIPEKFHNKIVIHRDFRKLESYNLGGVHFSSTNRPEKIESSKGKIKSTSCHSIEEVKAIGEEFTHCFLSPVFPSISKQGYDNVLNRKELRKFLEEERNIKIIGLGGINQKRLCELEGYLFDGYAVLGAVWGDNPAIEKNIEYNFRKIYECVKNVHIA